MIYSSETITVEKNRPLLLVDADEVILQFVKALEAFLLRNGYALSLKSFQLTGNITDIATGTVVTAPTVKDLISRFFDEDVDRIEPVDGAAHALAALSDRYQIIILSNVPERCRERRQNHLHGLGFEYPLIANAGGKGAAARALFDQAAAPTVFIDDLPPQHSAVAQSCPEIYRVHMVADERLAKLIGRAADAHHREDDWNLLTPHLLNHIQTQQRP